MAVFLLDAEVMAQARFGTSQLTETLAALNILRRGQPLPWHRGWRDRHVEAFLGYLDGDPVTAAIVAHAMSSTWMADFLTVPAAHPDMTLDDELLELESLPDDRIRADLAHVRAPLAPGLRATGLASRTADLLRWVWRHTIEADWPRRQSVLRADVVSRISRLGREGWSGVINDMRPGLRWLGDGRLQVEERPYPPSDVRGGTLTFFAAHCRGGWISWRLPDRFGIVYPVAGIFTEATPTTPDPLRSLLGNARSRVLVQAAEPVSTTGVVAATGLPLGTVGGHLRVLTEAGLLHKRRSGREVLYWWTDTARALVAGTSSS
ncbi:helix-turn-helix domain-containing protein [Micromonospora sp. NPDC005205]|uniref:ArsR/SmtB family transcription factor n=1 Tax=Micromonospora sp. NPDC005205 TaxID=3156714 RepID=UPI0033BBAD2C